MAKTKTERANGSLSRKAWHVGICNVFLICIVVRASRSCRRAPGQDFSRVIEKNIADWNFHLSVFLVIDFAILILLFLVAFTSCLINQQLVLLSGLLFC
jgi:hypothetical protein